MGYLAIFFKIELITEIILSIFITLINACFMVALVKKSSLHTPSNTILGCLCCSDLLIGIFSFLYLMLIMLDALPSFQHVDVYIATSRALAALNGLSSLFIVFVNFDRYAAICHPFWYLQYATIKRYSIASASTFSLYSVCITISVILDKRYNANSQLVIYNSIFIATILILMYCNWKILRVIARHRREVASIERISGVSHNSDKARYRIVIVLVVLFLFCKVPGIVNFILFTRASFQMSLLVLALVSDFLSLLNCFLNPLVYYFTIRVFRDAVKEVFRCQRHD